MARFSADNPGEARIRFGPAGWDYPDWAGKVYPAPKPKGFDPLRYLAGYFGTVEINSTFYRPASAKVARNWVERVAEHPRFRFTAKLYRRFTHERTSAWTREQVDEVKTGLDPLAEAGKLGARHLRGGLRAGARPQLQGLVPQDRRAR